MIYVFKNSNYFNGVFSTIGSRPDNLRILGIIGAYAAMGVGWYFLAASQADRWVKDGMNRIVAGLLAGAIFGFAVYGTYDFTNYVSFKNFSISFLLRDIIWGISWTAISVMLYSIKNPI
jgi:uncharacterized membrane protein